MALTDSQDPLNSLVIEHMLQLPGLNSDLIIQVCTHTFCLISLAYFASLCVYMCMQSVKQKSFDHISAIYNLLVDKLEKQHHHHMLQQPQLTSISATIPSYSYPQRKASITTGNPLASKICQKNINHVTHLQALLIATKSVTMIIILDLH